MATKVKVIEIDVAKLDPNAVHLIVFNKFNMLMTTKRAIAQQLDKLGVKAVYAESIDPENALKVYEIPRIKSIDIIK